MKDRIKEILHELDQEAIDNYSDFTSSGRRHFVHTLYEGLEYEDRKEFENTRVKGYVEKRQDKLAEVEFKHFQELNRPIDEVLKEFTDKKSGKRQKARKELCSRFTGQEWKVQLNILQAMIDVGSLVDITWVVEQIQSSYHHQLFIISRDNEQLVLEFKQKLHEGCLKFISYPKIAQYLVENSDLDFLKDHHQELENALGYRKVAIPLARYDREYKIDRSKLAFFQYLDILAQTDRPIKKADVWQEFIVWLLSVKEESVEWDRKPIGYLSEYGAIPSLLDIRQIKWLVKSCQLMQFFDIVCSIYDLDNHIRGLMDIPTMKYYDIDTAGMNCDAFIKMAKTIAWEYQPNILPDVTAYEKLKSAIDNIGAEEERLQDKIFLNFEGETCRLIVDENTNNYYFTNEFSFSNGLKPEHLASILAEANKEYNRNITAELTEKGCIVKSETNHVNHEGVFRLIFKSQLRSFLMYCSYFRKLIDQF